MLETPDLFCVKKMLATEVNVSKLSVMDRELFNEAEAREVSEFLNEQVLRRCKDNAELQEASGSGRLMKCRLVLTWKTIPYGEQEDAKKKRAAEGPGKTTVAEDGTYKAKARLVLVPNILILQPRS